MDRSRRLCCWRRWLVGDLGRAPRGALDDERELRRHVPRVARQRRPLETAANLQPCQRHACQPSEAKSSKHTKRTIPIIASPIGRRVARSRIIANDSGRGKAGCVVLVIDSRSG